MFLPVMKNNLKKAAVNVLQSHLYRRGKGDARICAFLSNEYFTVSFMHTSIVALFEKVSIRGIWKEDTET